MIAVVLILATLLILGSTAIIQTSTDIKISGNYRRSVQSFYAAESGVEEARARLRLGATNAITDSNPTNANWTAYIGTSSNAQGKGYNSGNSNHVRVDSINTDPNIVYTVKIQHAVSGSNVLRWGDSNNDGRYERNTTTGQIIYVVTSYGSYGNAQKALQVEMSRQPPVTVPGALYVEAATTIQGSSTNVIGNDACGGTNEPAVVTTLSSGSVRINGGPVIIGASPTIQYDAPNMDVHAMIDGQKGFANFSYNVTSETQTASQTPGPGDGWGVPVAGATQQSASTCSARNIVYYNTNNTFVKLSGGVQGCGILVVDGNLQLHGGFNWNGIILVSGSVTFLGGGSDTKNITGGIVAGGSVDADIVGGNANIVYCSSAVNNQTQNRPLRILDWHDMSF
ncbi:MAG: pilus assembly PilX N-terminal domain-containing protein [Smithellaceae bacterium]|nr:pilus assembly PilX N-terminal domain-containing protein [Smithellaceae bacterium]